jgi:hypothetical protein
VTDDLVVLKEHPGQADCMVFLRKICQS